MRRWHIEVVVVVGYCRQGQGVAQLHAAGPGCKGRESSDLGRVELAGAQKFWVTGSPSEGMT